MELMAFSYLTQRAFSNKEEEAANTEASDHFHIVAKIYG